ncbi:MAG: PilZ domain-containing protein [Planctomycetota bacterium]
MSEENRQYRRIDTNLIVTVAQRNLPAGGAASFKARLKDVSRGGIFIETADPPPIDSILEVELLVPGSTTTAVLKGMVVWSQPGKGAGLELIDVTSQTKGAISSLMQQGQQEA